MARVTKEKFLQIAEASLGKELFDNQKPLLEKAYDDAPPTISFSEDTVARSLRALRPMIAAIANLKTAEAESKANMEKELASKMPSDGSLHTREQVLEALAEGKPVSDLGELPDVPTPGECVKLVEEVRNSEGFGAKDLYKLLFLMNTSLIHVKQSHIEPVSDEHVGRVMHALLDMRREIKMEGLACTAEWWAVLGYALFTIVSLEVKDIESEKDIPASVT